MNKQVNQKSMQQRAEEASQVLGWWTAAWVLTMAVTNFGPTFIWDENPTISMISILINLLIGVGMIFANGKHLRTLDEMHQKIQLNAMALSLGVGLIVGLAYSNMDITNVISVDAEISHLVILMGLTYAFGIFKGMRIYR